MSKLRVKFRSNEKFCEAVRELSDRMRLKYTEVPTSLIVLLLNYLQEMPTPLRRQLAATFSKQLAAVANGAGSLGALAATMPPDDEAEPAIASADTVDVEIDSGSLVHELTNETDGIVDAVFDLFNELDVPPSSALLVAQEVLVMVACRALLGRVVDESLQDAAGIIMAELMTMLIPSLLEELDIQRKPSSGQEPGETSEKSRMQ